MAVVGGAVRVLTLAALAMLVGCAPWQPAPERGRSAPERAEERVVRAPPAWYRVSRGETLYSIAFRYGLNWQDLARWNRIGSPYTIRPGQELRMSAPPARRRSQPVAASPAPSGQGAKTDSAPSQEESSAAEQPDKPDPVERAEPTPPRDAPPDAAASDESRTVAGVTWQWPTNGKLQRAFDPAATRRGIGIAGKTGQSVHAAAAGQVVYSGTALIGYGELIIIKHSDKLLSAYGHNSRRLVGEGDRVGRGQKVAEMGRDDRREELLHFEIRRDGEPVNPLDYLPRVNQQ